MREHLEQGIPVVCKELVYRIIWLRNFLLLLHSVLGWDGTWQLIDADMPFPHAAEIIDLIAQSLVQQGYDDRADDIVEYIKNFRLVCREFAAIGLQYLVPILVVMRTPESLDKALEVANHPVLYRHVERLVFYHDAFIARSDRQRTSDSVSTDFRRATQFLDSEEDLQKLEQLLQKLPNLEHVELLGIGADMKLHHGYEPKELSSKFRSEYSLVPYRKPSLEFLNLVPRMKVLVMTGIRWPLSSHVDLTILRKLSVTIPRTSSTLPSVLGEMPLLEELQYSGPLTPTPYYPWHERLVALPPTLKELRLRHIEFSEEPFPANIHTLELYNVIIGTDTLPDKLRSVSFTDVTWHSLFLDKWVDIFLSLKPGCEFDIAGGFLTDSNAHDPVLYKSYVHCSCFSSKTTVGLVLAKILQLQAESGSKEGLLRRLFEECNRPDLLGPGDLHRATPTRLEISKVFHADYLEVMAQCRDTPEVVVARNLYCADCDSRHGSVWSGVVG